MLRLSKSKKKLRKGFDPIDGQLLFKEVDALIKANGIPMWLDSGTLLGAVRDGAFIPWDNDIDVAVWELDAPVLINSLNHLKEKGVKVRLGRQQVGVFLLSAELNISFFREVDGTALKYQKYVFGSIIFFDLLLNDLIWALDNSPYRNVKTTLRFGFRNFLVISLAKVGLFFPVISRRISQLIKSFGELKESWSVPEEYFCELTELSFYGVDVSVPKNYLNYLEYRYGRNWMTPNKSWDTDTQDGAVTGHF